MDKGDVVRETTVIIQVTQPDGEFMHQHGSGRMWSPIRCFKHGITGCHRYSWVNIYDEPWVRYSSHDWFLPYNLTVDGFHLTPPDVMKMNEE